MQRTQAEARSELCGTTGYLVTDSSGHWIGKVECPMYGTSPTVPDALAVKTGALIHHRKIVPAETIAEIHGLSGVVALSTDRASLASF